MRSNLTFWFSFGTLLIDISVRFSDWFSIIVYPIFASQLTEVIPNIFSLAILFRFYLYYFNLIWQNSPKWPQTRVKPILLPCTFNLIWCSSTWPLETIGKLTTWDSVSFSVSSTMSTLWLKPDFSPSLWPFILTSALWYHGSSAAREPEAKRKVPNFIFKCIRRKCQNRIKFNYKYLIISTICSID